MTDDDDDDNDRRLSGFHRQDENCDMHLTDDWDMSDLSECISLCFVLHCRRVFNVNTVHPSVRSVRHHLAG